MTNYRKIENGYEIADLMRVMRGDPDPWHSVTFPVKGMVYLRSVSDCGIYVGGLSVGADDMAAVLGAVQLAPQLGHEHDPEANGRREAAGKEALTVTDSMVRARLLDAVDGWSALIADPKRVIERTEEGTLCIAPDGMTCRLLVVRCPSTARIYALRVPAHFTRVADARRWVMQNQSPEVET